MKPMRIGVCWEKRDWGAGRPTWREQQRVYRRYRRFPRTDVLPSFAIRVLSNREAKRRMQQGEVCIY